MPAIVDILRVSVYVFFSLLIKPKRHTARSWHTEFVFRLAKKLIKESIQHPMSWLRRRQDVMQSLIPMQREVISYAQAIDGVNCQVVYPMQADALDKTIIYLHGGGYCVGSAKNSEALLAHIAECCNARVIGVDYRLCPDFAIPAPQEDCVKVTESLIKHMPSQRLVLMGDSAGGALCLETLKALDNAGMASAIDACVLISPWLDPLHPEVLTSENEDTDMIGRVVTTHWKDTFYLGPAQADFVDMTDINIDALPKLYIQAAGAEVFLGQIETFVEKLNNSGHEYTYDVFEGQFHVFQTLTPLVKEADQALQSVANFLK